MLSQSLNDGRELDVMTFQLLEETVETHRIGHVLIVHDGHGVVFHAMLFQQVDALAHLVVGGEPLLVSSVVIVNDLWTVDREADQEVVLPEKATPLIGQQRAIGFICQKKEKEILK